MKVLRVPVVVLALTAAGCVNKLPTYEFENRRVLFDATEQVWIRTNNYFAANGISVVTADEANGRLVGRTQGIHPTIMAKYAACPDNPLLINPRTGELTYNIAIERVDDERSRLTVEIVPRMTYFDATSDYVTYNCNSNGTEETRLLDVVNVH
jgi:hypothetical protein